MEPKFRSQHNFLLSQVNKPSVREHMIVVLVYIHTESLRKIPFAREREDEKLARRQKRQKMLRGGETECFQNQHFQTEITKQ